MKIFNHFVISLYKKNIGINFTIKYIKIFILKNTWKFINDKLFYFYLKMNYN